MAKKLKFKIHNKLDEILRSRGIKSVGRMSRLLGLTRPTIYNHIDNNNNELIRLGTILQILHLLDIKFEDLFEWELEEGE
jgi:DNA-binding Xre family transcriptional regulator